MSFPNAPFPRGGSKAQDEVKEVYDIEKNESKQNFAKFKKLKGRIGMCE
jgi:hypothetical protein